jgi:hypothetical protein
MVFLCGLFGNVLSTSCYIDTNDKNNGTYQSEGVWKDTVVACFRAILSQHCQVML